MGFVIALLMIVLRHVSFQLRRRMKYSNNHPYPARKGGKQPVVRKVTMMQLNHDQKQQVLLAVLQERYSASHKIRERSIQFTMWISGMAILLGWLLITERALGLSQRVALTLLILPLFAGTIHFISGLARGFRKNREVMIICERALGLHDSGIYLKDCPLLPTEYNRTKRKWSDHFFTLTVWLILMAGALFMLTWTHPNSTKDLLSDSKIEQIKGGNNNG